MIMKDEWGGDRVSLRVGHILEMRRGGGIVT